MLRYVVHHEKEMTVAEDDGSEDDLAYNMDDPVDRLAFAAHMIVVHLIEEEEPSPSEVDGFFGEPSILSSILAAQMVSEDEGYLLKFLGGGLVSSPMHIIKASIMGGPELHGKAKAYAPTSRTHELERKMSLWIESFQDEIDPVSAANGWTFVALIRYWLNSRRGAELAISRIAEEAFEGETIARELRDNINEYGVPGWARAGART